MKLLIRFFVKDYDNINSPKVRAEYATLTGVCGIVFNAFLFIIKMIAGMLSGSISVISDAFNNLSDAGASIITMVGFRISGQEADAEHPYGHGRSEYIAGLVISFLILLVGAELIKESVLKIINPEPVDINIWLFSSLVVSVAIKLYMFVYNTDVAKKLNAPALYATARDSINDVFTTTVVLSAAFVEAMTGKNVDGICGIFVGIIIFKGGVDIFRETSGLLLGKAATPEYKQKIKDLVLSYDGILGVHDLIVHDYGPGHQIISLHAEVEASANILEMHDIIDNIERHLQTDFSAQVTIHMDPIVTDDEELNYLREIVTEYANEIDTKISIHDFRMVKGNTHSNLIFDVVVPYSSKMDPREVRRLLTEKIRELSGDYYGVITLDRE